MGPYHAYTLDGPHYEGPLLGVALKGTNRRGPYRGPIKWAHMDPKGDPYMGPNYRPPYGALLALSMFVQYRPLEGAPSHTGIGP